MICIVWLERPFNRVQEVFSTYRDFIFYLKRNPELSSVLKTLQRNKFINKKIQHAYISLEKEGNNHTFSTKNEFMDFLIKNPEIAKSIGFNEVNKKRGEIKVELTDFASRLRVSMERNQLSQTALSKMIGTSQPEVSHYLKSKALPRPYILQRLALVLNVSYYWLKTGGGKMEVVSPYPLNEFWATLNERIVFLLMINNLKPKDLEGKIGKWTSLISSWCDGIRTPTEDQMILLSDYFKVELVWLSGGHPINHPITLKKFHNLLGL